MEQNLASWMATECEQDGRQKHSITEALLWCSLFWLAIQFHYFLITWPFHVIGLFWNFGEIRSFVNHKCTSSLCKNKIAINNVTYTAHIHVYSYKGTFDVIWIWRKNSAPFHLHSNGIKDIFTRAHIHKFYALFVKWNYPVWKWHPMSNEYNKNHINNWKFHWLLRNISQF